ncbi:MAG: RpiB/LacA/LacB family sugar-phosphate isomerase [Bacteroidetes bacterium]|nr:RpiB/LacA/LacB family sugar-phosphate isomerase [Bacteroidota bacterium]
MPLLIASDHAGVDLKRHLCSYLDGKGIAYEDLGPATADSVDYPDYAHPLAGRVNARPTEVSGILICGSGNGVCMTANKYAQVRAALVWTAELAALARQHNDANILCLPARFISQEVAVAAVEAFLNTAFEGGRHANRVAKIAAGC